jgi:uncharacterized lipoprotein NlpE involved in copper resistance
MRPHTALFLLFFVSLTGCHANSPFIGTWTCTINGLPLKRTFNSDKTYKLETSMGSTTVTESGTWSSTDTQLVVTVDHVDINGIAGTAAQTLRKTVEQMDQKTVTTPYALQGGNQIVLTADSGPITLTRAS